MQQSHWSYRIRANPNTDEPAIPWEEAIKKTGVYVSASPNFDDSFLIVAPRFDPDSPDILPGMNIMILTSCRKNRGLTILHNINWSETSWPKHKWFAAIGIDINIADLLSPTLDTAPNGA
jgi:hypothetical protein